MRVQLLLKTGEVRESDTREVVLGEKRVQDNGYYSQVLWKTEYGEVHQADVMEVTTSGDFRLIRDRIDNEREKTAVCEALKRLIRS